VLNERGVEVDQSTISRTFSAKGWNKKTLRLISLNQSEALRDAYREAMSRYTADDLVFINEAIFCEKTGWRHHA
jgi:hypothetical protein